MFAVSDVMCLWWSYVLWWHVFVVSDVMCLCLWCLVFVISVRCKL